MSYPSMTSADANNYLTKKRGDPEAFNEPLVRMKGEERDFDDSFVQELREALGNLQETWPDGLKNDQQAGDFEAKAPKIVHQLMLPDTEIQCDPEFWIWLAVVHFGELVEWRYRNPAKGTTLANYGVGSRTENLLYRLWLRAEIALDEDAEDRYHLATAGQIDFYRSHLFRKRYANARGFARALIRFQYPHEDPAEPKLQLKEIRELAKRLGRLRSNLYLEILTEVECRAVIEMEAVQVVTANDH